MSYTQNNSHDPKTDHRSLGILVIIVLFGIAGVIALMIGDTTKPASVDPYKYAEVDGCSVYRFDDEEGPNYFANCPTGNSAVTMARGKFIPSFKADTIEL